MLNFINKIERLVPESPSAEIDWYEIDKLFAATCFSEMKTTPQNAREHLRKKEPFIWNATNLTKDTRRKMVSLFERYGARVRIVYLETDWNTRVERNLGRKEEVPEAVVERMLRIMVLPTPDEAQSVEWLMT